MWSDAPESWATEKMQHSLASVAEYDPKNDACLDFCLDLLQKFPDGCLSTK